MLSGAVILFTHWTWLDPLVSLAVAFFILVSTWELFKDSLNFSLDAVPENIDPEAVRAYLGALPEVTEVHHVHIWPLSTTEVALTAHLVKKEPLIDDTLLERIREDLHHQFGIAHPTIQFESSTAACREEHKH
jgi:cobalt-zinc-cadmium efflux system protein